MSVDRRLLAWGVAIGAVGAAFYLLHGILFPFVAGIAVAYLLDPVADWLESRGVSRPVATLLILATFFVIVIVALLLLAPLLYSQIAALLARVPEYTQGLRDSVSAMLVDLKARLRDEDMQRLQETLGGYAGDALRWLAGIVAGIWRGGLALFNLISLIVITPLVAFYLLRDWDSIVARLDAMIPRPAVDSIRAQVREIDERLAGFVRGQATVCLILGTIYAVGLTLIGLDFGLLVGIGAGLISFIPYLGTIIGLAVGVGLAVAQFGVSWPVVLVAAVFGIGQVLEGYVLTPKLVGDRVGLHPVWVLFALMAGGTMFGFTGVLVAIPAAAALGVIIRHAVERYRGSDTYRGGGAAPIGFAPTGDDERS